MLRTKFFLPPVRPDLIERLRLMESLASGLAVPLTLVSAPAGFGKTTLISAWRHSPAAACFRIAWLALDSDDDDAPRFLRYVIGAFAEVQPGVGAQAAHLLASSPATPTRAVLNALLNDLSQLADPWVLVMDDYHLMSQEAIHEAVSYFVEHLPPRVHVVVLSRSDPFGLPLGRLRAHGHLVEIRADDLRFTATEAAQFLNDVMCLELSASAIAALEARTEGWIAGLRLAALSLVHRPDREHFVAAFTGGHRFLVEYLVHDVIDGQPETVRQFLLETSILDRLCGPLCDALRVEQPAQGPGRPSSEILETLERANLFIVPLDERSYWHRYHHLFREILYAHLQKSQPERVPGLHRAASVWHESQDLLAPAFRHAVQTGDWAVAAGVVERNGTTLIGRSQIALLHDWCAMIPESVIRARPALCIFASWAQVLAFRSDRDVPVAERLSLAEGAVADLDRAVVAQVVPGAPPVPLRDWVNGHVALIRSMLVMVPSRPIDPEALMSLSRSALAYLPESDRLNRAVGAINLALAQLAYSNAPAAEVALDEALRLTLESDNYLGAATVAFYQARVAFWQSQLRRAADICRDRRQRLASAFQRPEQELPALRSMDVALAVVQLEWNDLEGAQQLLEQSLDAVGWATWVEVIGYAALARVRALRGDLAGAQKVLDGLTQLGPDLEPCLHALRMRYRVLDADPQAMAEAGAWAQVHRTDWNDESTIPGMGPFRCDVDYLTGQAWAQVQIAVGHGEAALHFLEPVLLHAEHHALTHRVIELSFAVAQARQLQGDTRRSLAALEHAVSLAEPAGYVRVFDQGPGAVRLLEEAARRGVAPDYLHRVLAIVDPVGPARHAEPRVVGASTAPLVAALIEPLSQRELEVLRLMALGLSNREIAARLFIEVGTVKRHVHGVFGKLDAKTRTQALARGRVAGLLQ